MKTYTEKAIFEHQFWLQIMGDHARFLSNAYYPYEKESIKEANKFIKTYDELLEISKQPNINVLELTKTAKVVTEDFQAFKLLLIEKQVTKAVGIHFSPTFINHMVNELEEYLLVISFLEDNKIPPTFHELHHHLLWLLDASGHAGAINDCLDGTEYQLKEKSKHFLEEFDHFYLKAVELTGYLRSNISSFPALTKFNSEVQLAMALFQTFLQELEELDLSDQLLGSFSALMADHMYREECYYLTKLAETTKLAYPNSDLAKPRTNR